MILPTKHNPSYKLEAIKTCLAVGMLAGSAWPADCQGGWKHSEHPLACQVEHSLSHSHGAWCHAPEAKINSSVTHEGQEADPAVAVHQQLPCLYLQPEPWPISQL